MPRNVYISTGPRNEQNLYEDLIIEAMKIYGSDVYYIPRKILKADTILNEDVLSKFDDAFKIEMYFESQDGFEGDGKLLAKFGLEIRYQMTLVVSRRRWNALIGRFGYADNSARPREGDLIYFPTSGGLFEIKFVQDKSPFYQLNNIPTFKLVCEMFEYGSQDIDTGISQIDSIQSNSSNVYRAVIQFDDVNNKHPLNESVTITLPSGVTGEAKLLAYEKSSDGTITADFGTLTFHDGEWHQLTADTVITSGDATSIIVNVIGLEDGDSTLFVNDDFAQNSSFETIGNSFIDFSESNPFGEV